MRERCGDDMIRIAIVDDENMVCSGIEDIVFQLSMDNDIELETEVYLSGNELCSALKSHECFNLIFLDIEMDNGDGISAGNYLRDKLQNDTTQIVYVSGKNGYDRQLFEFHPRSCIEKPVSFDKLNKVLKKYLKSSARLTTVNMTTVVISVNATAVRMKSVHHIVLLMILIQKKMVWLRYVTVILWNRKELKL